MVNEEPTQESSVSIPKELSFPIPKSLKSKDNESINQEIYQKRDRSEHRQFGYFQLKKDISLLENKQLMVEKNLAFINQIILQITQECKKNSPNELCHSIDVHYTFTEEETGKKYPLEIMYFLKKELQSKPYYEIKVDMSYYFHHREDNDFIEEDDVVIQTVLWSKDENNISTKLFFNNEITTSEISINYVRKANGQKYMDLKEEYIELYDNTISTYYLALLKEKNKEEYTIDSHYATTFTFDDGEREKAIDDVKGFLGEETGHLIFTFSEYEVDLEDDHIISGLTMSGISSTFDIEGNELNSTECNIDENCDLNDPTTWEDRPLE